MNELTIEEKINKLNLQQYHNKFSEEQINILYKNYENEQLNKLNVTVILKILNDDILEKLGRDKIEDICNFRITREELLQIDGEQIVKDNWTDLKRIGIKKTKDLHFSRKTQIKVFSLTVIKGLLNYIGYELKHHQSSKLNKITNNCEAIYYYKAYNIR